MKILSMMLVVTVTLLACGCGGDSVVNPPAVDEWTFPANSSKFSATLYSTSSTVAINGTSDVRLVLYNVSSLFGAAFEISVPQDSLEVTEVLQGKVFGSTSDAIVVSQIEPAQKRVSYGITLKAGSTAAFTGSNVILKMKVVGKIAGPVNVRINPLTLELKTSAGQPISNFANIAVENLTLTVQ
jgi:hypothetical protein